MAAPVIRLRVVKDPILVAATAPKRRAKRKYVPRVKLEDGRYVRTDGGRPRPWTPEAFAATRAIEKYVRDHGVAGFTRWMPAKTWNALMDALPICPCGRTVAPVRAKRFRGDEATEAWAFCSPRCKAATYSRRAAKRRKAEMGDVLDPRREARAIAEAIGQ